MITQSLLRASRASCSSTPSRTVSLAINGQACRIVACSSRAHQRRPSSSKASVPPNGAAPRTRSSAPSQQKVPSTSTRVRGRKAKAPVVESGYAHLPSVPSTQHLPLADISVSSFFSLHRPISITTVVPATTSLATFSNLFERPSPAINHQSAHVLNTLGTAVNQLESPAPHPAPQPAAEPAPEQAQADEAAAAQPGVGVPRDIPVAGFRPFTPPAVPETSQSSQNVNLLGRSKRTVAASSEQSKERSWMTTITVTEHTTATGKRTYSAASTPLEQIDQVQSGTFFNQAVVQELEQGPRQVRIEQPFLQRMRIRQMKWEESRKEQMKAISVKRQRKLKMKRHKYKKLMKRTRNLRRKMGKL